MACKQKQERFSEGQEMVETAAVVLKLWKDPVATLYVWNFLQISQVHEIDDFIRNMKYYLNKL